MQPLPLHESFKNFMKIGYPCINRSVGCTANSTFRLASYSDERLIQTISNNLVCLQKILDYNARNGLFFLRISSDIIPFASHPVCTFPWDDYFGPAFRRLGRFIKKYDIRITMHPDQFVVLNSPKPDVVERSIAELVYHCTVLDAMKLPCSAKVQIHVGGVYNDKKAAIERFIRTYETLPAVVKKRLVIEHDERSYSLKECISIHENIGIPVVFDVFHHACCNHKQTIKQALHLIKRTWKKRDGLPVVHYSSQQKGAVEGKHAESIDVKDFRRFLQSAGAFDFACMLEIKDKEKSALKALAIIKQMKVDTG